MVDIGNMVSESFGYAKEALFGRWVNWILLIIGSVIFPFMMGYSVWVMKGTKPAPELKDWGRMFVDGLKLFIIGIIYAIPILIVLFFLVGSTALMAVSAQANNPAAVMAFFAGMLLYFILLLILGIIIGLFAATGYVRFARTGSMGEAFNFGGICAQIGKIGWGGYILSLIVLIIILGIIAGILWMIPVIGWLLYLIALPFLAIVESRYLSMLYDYGEPAPAPGAP